MTVTRRSVGDLLGAAFELSDRMNREDASGWLVVVVDLEPDPAAIVHAYGPYPTPEAALLASEELKRDGPIPEPDEDGWRYDIVPLYPPPAPRPAGR